MSSPRWLLAIPIMLSAALVPTPTNGSTVRDRAHMFSADAVKKAQAELNRIRAGDPYPGCD